MKLRTRKRVAKRVKVTWSGKFKLGKAWKSHLLSNKSKKAKGRNQYGLIADKTETKKIRQQLPYS